MAINACYRGTTKTKIIWEKFLRTKHLTCNITVNLTAEKPTKGRSLNPVNSESTA
jgi:hypothetical protein